MSSVRRIQKAGEVVRCVNLKSDRRQEKCKLKEISLWSLKVSGFTPARSALGQMIKSKHFCWTTSKIGLISILEKSLY